MNRRIYILGAGGLAKEFGAYIKYINSEYMLKGFYDDIKSGAVGSLGSVEGKINEAAELENDTNLILGVGQPQLKSKFYGMIAKPERFRWPSFIQQGVSISDNQALRYGKGCMICAGSSLTTDITLGNHVLINLNCTIGHDVEIGDYTSIMPGSHLSGMVKIGKNVLIGTGATILQNIEIGDNAIVGAGAVVTRNVTAGSTVKGIPAR